MTTVSFYNIRDCGYFYFLITAEKGAATVFKKANIKRRTKYFDLVFYAC
jgi:hypothetical protein